MMGIIQILICILPLAFASPNIAPVMAIKGGTSHACAACKYQRRKCAPECPLRHYFPAENHRNFLNAHRLFGVSNIVKTLKNLNDEHKADAMQSIIYESNIREKFPVYGCMWVIYQLQCQIHQALEEFHFLKARIAACKCDMQQEEINLKPPSEIAFSNDYSQNHDQFGVENGHLTTSPNYFVPSENGNYNNLGSGDQNDEMKPTSSLHGKQPDHNFIDNKSRVVSTDEFLVQTADQVDENKDSILCGIGLPTHNDDEPTNVNDEHHKNQIVSADALQFLVDHETDEAPDDHNNMPINIVAAADQRSVAAEHCESSLNASSAFKNRQVREGNVCMDEIGAAADLFFGCNEVGKIRTITNL